MQTADEIVEGLEELGEFLRRKGVIKDDSPFRNARNQFSKNPKKYTVLGLQFTPVQGDYVRGDIWDTELEIVMNAEIEVTDKFKFSDASRMIIDIGYTCMDKAGNKECKGCWHMDYHVQDGKPEFMHPDFHIHHGGRKINDLENYGELVILDNPRIMHHPLDVFLGIDFIISNFYPEREWQKLRNDQRYKRMILLAQLNWWQPYYESLANYWLHLGKGKNATNSLKHLEIAKKLNPHYI